MMTKGGIMTIAGFFVVACVIVVLVLQHLEYRNFEKKLNEQTMQLRRIYADCKELEQSIEDLNRELSKLEELSKENYDEFFDTRDTGHGYSTDKNVGL